MSDAIYITECFECGKDIKIKIEKQIGDELVATQGIDPIDFICEKCEVKRDE